jgi:hypothetical protein
LPRDCSVSVGDGQRGAGREAGMGCFRGGVIGLVGMLAAGPAQAWQATDCSKLRIHLAGAAAATRVECKADEIGKDELIDAYGVGSVLFIIHHGVADTGRIYIPRIEVKHLVEDVVTSKNLSDWTEPTQAKDFDVIRFKGALAAGGAAMACVGFSRYAGHVDHTPGYRHVVVGVLCDRADQAPSEARLDEVLDSIGADFW